MSLFGKKKEQVDAAKQPNVDLFDVGTPKEILHDIERHVKPAPMKPPEKKIEKSDKQERPAFASLFVKIDRYRQMLAVIGSLKTAMMVVKNSFNTLNELDKAKEDTINLIKNSIDNVDKKINDLDSELIRPAGFHDPTASETEKMAYQDAESVDATIAYLKGQIEQLKSELEQIS